MINAAFKGDIDSVHYIEARSGHARWFDHPLQPQGRVAPNQVTTTYTPQNKPKSPGCSRLSRSILRGKDEENELRIVCEELFHPSACLSKTCTFKAIEQQV